MTEPTRQRFRLSGGSELSFLVAGDPANPAVLLIHGFPSSARTFRGVIPALAQATYVIAPDLPGFGESDMLSATSFAAFAAAVTELLEHLRVGPRYIYLHDFGAPVGFALAIAAPAKVLGLIIQNGNAHESGFGPEWAATKRFWSDPSDRNARAATAHLTLEGTRDQYIAGVPEDIAARIAPAVWEEDWRVMSLPGRLEMHRALIADYGNYAAGFPAIADYLERRQPPALLLWGRHDAFFALAEVLSWLETLPRMEAHIFDAGHFVLETHAEQAGQLMLEFIKRTTQAGA